MDELRPQIDPFKQLAEISDREERERFRREWGLLGLDEHRRPGFVPISGGGYQSAINAGAVGGDPESFFGPDSEGLKAYTSRRGTRRRQWRYLTKQQVGRLYDAVEFFNLEYGRVFNSHITIVYTIFGVTDHDAAAKLLSEFHRETAAWLRGRKYRYDYIYVHENSRDQGIHTHLLAEVPFWHRREFRAWAQRFFHRRFGQFQREALNIQIRKTPNDPMQILEWQWDRFKYLCKGIDPTLTARGEDGRRYPLRHLLQLPELRPCNDVRCSQRCGGSHRIWRAAQSRVGSGRSAFRRAEWSHLYTNGQPRDAVSVFNARTRLYADPQQLSPPRQELRELMRKLDI